MGFGLKLGIGKVWRTNQSVQLSHRGHCPQPALSKKPSAGWTKHALSLHHPTWNDTQSHTSLKE
jgi:hypothetical protein